MAIIKALLAIIVLLTSAWLFFKASGSLSVKRLNIISFAFYKILIVTWVGAFFILLGFRDHYLAVKIES